MRNDIDFEMWVRQPVEEAMAQIADDASQFKIEPEEFDRAVFGWIMRRMTAMGTPEWLESELNRLEE